MQSITNSLLAYPIKHIYEHSRADIFLHLQLVQSKQVNHLSMMTTVAAAFKVWNYWRSLHFFQGVSSVNSKLFHNNTKLLFAF